MKQVIHVLIVEDESLVAVDIEEALIRAGFSISGIARNYDEAVRLIGQKPVDIAVVDVGLGDDIRDGVATARELLRQHWMPLIYLTGTTDEATFERAKATNPYAFLNKPLRTQELVQQVQLALHNFRQETPINSPSPDKPVYWPTELGYTRIDQSEICYLKAAGNFTDAYLTAEAAKRIMPGTKPHQPLMLTGNLKHWGLHLSTRVFYRLSKSLLVNLTHIERVDSQQAMIGIHPLSLTATTRRNLMEQLNIVRTR